jgi:hypothetical protein
MLLAHPEVPSCSQCQAWLFDDRWRHVTRAGEPVLRPAGATTPCRSCPKSHDGQPNPGADLTPRSRAVIEHYQQCRAVGRFPEDAIVEEHAGLLHAIEEQLARKQQAETRRLLVLAIRKKGDSHG